MSSTIIWTKSVVETPLDHWRMGRIFGGRMGPKGRADWWNPTKCGQHSFVGPGAVHIVPTAARSGLNQRP